MVIPGYAAGAALLRTGPYVVHRGWRTADRHPVLLKTTSGPTRPSDRGALEREYQLLRSVSIAGVPEAIELVAAAEGDAPVLVLDDRGFSAVQGGIRDARDLAFFFAAATALARTIADLHRADLICAAVAPSALAVAGDGRSIQLLDFSLTARLSVDTAVEAAPSWGVTPYSSPEQTGRLNRAVDHRSDLYSFGATLYYLLTGEPPFRSDDPLGLIHAHLAKTPVPPRRVNPVVPEQVSAIVMRLLAKAAEDRYQTALGVLADLDVCAREWHASGAIRAFDLGRSDVSDRFLIPRRLYGRDRERGALTAAFDDACGGRASLLLVSGYSGIGKTSLIRELYRPIVTQRGYFLAGKFDQVVRSVPYGALIQAFRAFVWQVLGESEDSLGQWRRRLSTALGTNGGVIAEVIPEIEFVIGRQAAPPALDPAEAQNRFRYVFHNFVAAVGGPEHPLVVFLDDLQWADSATLELLHALLTGADLHHVLFIGAYRDNEVDAHHLLTWAVDRLHAAGAPVRRLSLGPLTLPDVAEFLRETLHCSADEVRPLAVLIEQKTGGNPFFVIQFLKTLQHEGLFRFDSASGAWTFRMDAIAAAGMTDNVIDLMTRNIRRLSPPAQRVLRLAACIGNPFAWRTFLTVSRQSAEDASEGLQEALDAGLLRAEAARFDGGSGQPEAYAFLHDRVQQAAYDLMGDEQKRQVHLDVGRLLLAECGGDVPEDRLFEIVNHLNIGRELVTEPAERVRAATLNLAAGRKAKLSAAYTAACAYLTEGIARLSDASWSADYELMFALRLEAAESHYLAGDFERAEHLFELLLARAATAADRAQVHSLRIVLYENLTRYADALASARDGLAIFGIVFPERDADAQALLEAEIAAIDRLRGGRPIAALVDLPVMEDAPTRVVLRILTLMWAAAYIAGARPTAGLISATMVRLSLEHGLTEDTAYGCVTHAITIGPINRDYASAYEWGELALQLNERFGDRKRRAKIHQQYHAHVKLWRRPFATCLPHAREACRSGLEAGDFTYAGYGAVSETWPAFVISRSLDQFVRDYLPAVALLDRIRMSGFRTAAQVTINWALALQGKTAAPLSLTDARFDEEAFIVQHGTSAAPFFLTFVYTAKLHLAVLLEAYTEGVRLARLAREVTVAGTLWPVLVEFWGGLAMTGAWPSASDGERREYQTILEASRASLRELADNCPENFRCFWLALCGEMARVAGDRRHALSLFEEALAYARETGNLQQEALANELCGRVWLAGSDRDAAAPFLRAARAAYAAWGAVTKVARLDSAYGAMTGRGDAAAGSAPTALPELATDGALVDMASVLKMARAIAVEIELDELLRKLMTIALENAGAERGLFLQERDGSLMIEAEARASGGPVLVRQSLPWESCADLSHSVVRYVRRTGQDLVVGNLAGDERFASDPYVAATAARAVLCVPVGHQGRSAGLLYLENNLTTGAFTPQRIEMMRILAAQAAISIENARLYDSMKTEVERRTVAEQSLREAVAELEALKNRLEAENVYLQEEIRTQHNFIDIVGNSPALLEVLRRVELVGPTESTVLLLGETGSGKELFARAVHSRSQRRDRPLVKVNCGAIPPGLVESELFGHVKGAFTGAVDKRVGRFEVADGGTLMLDEIGELPLDAQVKLLRVLQEQEFEPVGSSRTIRVDVRVIAATNRNLERAVKDGTFRADLLYRLNVFPIEIPPLRARREDIPLLANLFVRGLARKLGKPLQGFSAKSMERLIAYSWPGNVRELQNVVERAAILATGPVLDVDASSMAGHTAGGAAAGRRAETLDGIQRDHIVAVLQSTGGVVEGARGAATILGLHPNTLRSRMKKLGITPASWSST